MGVMPISWLSNWTTRPLGVESIDRWPVLRELLFTSVPSIASTRSCHALSVQCSQIRRSSTPSCPRTNQYAVNDSVRSALSGISTRA